MLDLTWYYTLNRPPLSPPEWIFAPVWTFLYILIFVALFMYSTKSSDKGKCWGYLLFFIQLIINLLWTPTFFYSHNICLALVFIVLMDILTVLIIIEFSQVSKVSATLFIPYFLWVLFATYLNYYYFILN